MIDYLQTIDDVCENLEDYNFIIVFNNMIANMESNESIDTELFLRGRKLNILLVFVSQAYFKVCKTIRLNETHYFIMKIPNK